MAHIRESRVAESTTTTGAGALTLAAALTGFRTFASVCAVNDTVWYAAWAVDGNGNASGDYEEGLGTYSAAATLTRTAVLRSSNSNNAVNFAAGTKYVAIADIAPRSVGMNNELAVPLPVVAATPAAAAADTLKLYAMKRAGRVLAAMIGPSGVDNILQPQLWGNRVMLWYPGSGTGLGSFGLTPTTAATLSHPTPATTTFAESLYRTRFQTSTTAGNAAGVRDAVNTVWRGNSAGRGGFFAHFRLCSGNISLSGGQIIVGLSSSTAALGGEPSALADVLGVGKDIADTNWQFMRRTGSGTVQKVDLGVAIANNQAFDLHLYSRPNGSGIGVRVAQHDFAGGVTELLNTEYTTHIPAAATLLGRHCQVRNGATAAAANVELVRSYLESDF